MSELLANDLVNYKIFKLVEREKIDAVFKELALQKTGVIDEKTAVKIGKLLGTKYILLGSFILNQSIIKTDIRVVTVETGETILIAHSMGDKNDLFKICTNLTKELFNKMKTIQ